MSSLPSVGVVGLGYVGLPLAHALAKRGYAVQGYDLSAERIAALQAGNDWTGEVSHAELAGTTMTFTTDPSCLRQAQVIIVTVPTPIDAQNKPDLSPVTSAMETVGRYLQRGAIVVLESTVYPGVTEEICGPILEAQSGLRCGIDFSLGYSPERINPGDREHTVTRITKVVSGQDAATLEALASLYSDVTSGGVHRAPSIKVAEMAKAIENAQRDLNIAYMNEVALLCQRLGIRSKDVLEAAGTKWNFLRFQPGLVGGHCIGVDPYYLVERAEQLGMQTHVISAGRAVNDGIAGVVVQQVLTALDRPAAGARVLVLGLTFKEDIPDTRNSKSFDVIAALQQAGCEVAVADPMVPDGQLQRFGLTRAQQSDGAYDAVLFLVPHAAFRAYAHSEWLRLTRAGGVLYDLKSLLDVAPFVAQGRRVLSL
jgi:UDP-N-acetyl-D-galactosamine dehydrogenase